MGDNGMRTTEARNMPSKSGLGRKLGIAAFLFFLIKGLLWLAAPVVLYFMI